MNDLVDIHTPPVASKNARVEFGRDGVLHVPVGPKAEANAEVRALPVKLR
jgi:hypothetical protein